MYNNIGGKIKGLAKATFVVEAIAAVITGIVFIDSDDDMIPIGLLLIVVGPIVAWVSSWLLYGFGELIDKICEIARNTYNGDINQLERLRSQGLITEEEYQNTLWKEKECESELLL